MESSIQSRLGQGIGRERVVGRAAPPPTEHYSNRAPPPLSTPPPEYPLPPSSSTKDPPPIPGFSEQLRDSFALKFFAETLFLCYSAKSMAILRSQGKLYLKTAFLGKASHGKSLEHIQDPSH